MIRKMVQLTEKQVKSLEQFAQKEGVPVSELIGRAIDQFIYAQNERDEEIRKKVSNFVGMIRDDTISDLSTNHDLYLAQIYEQQHANQSDIEKEPQSI